MNLRSMLRQYAQYESRSTRGHSCILTMHQGHTQRLRYGEAVNWMIDFGKALDSLEGQARTALLLVRGAGYSQQETVNLMGIPLRTLQRIMADAETALEKALADQAAGIPLKRSTPPRRNRCRG